MKAARPTGTRYRTSAEVFAADAKKQDESGNSGMDQSSPRDNPNLLPKIVSILSSHSCISLPKRQEGLYSLPSSPDSL